MRKTGPIPRLWKCRRPACLLALALCLSPGASGGASAPPRKRFSGQVTRVFDGSSFQLGRGLRSALIGVAAPRLNARGGREALDFLGRLLKGNTVFLEIDERLVDAYGQAQYYVFLEDGTFVNALVLLRGLGRAVVKHPNVRYRSRLIEAERTARAFRRGIWGDEFPDPKDPYPDTPDRWEPPPLPVFPHRRFP